MGGTKTTTTTVTRTVTTQASPGPNGLAPPVTVTYFGTPVSITKVDAKRYLLVLQPAFFLTGVTARVAYSATQGTTCAPLSCSGPPNDYWVTPAGSADLTFILPAKTTGIVLTIGSDGNEHATTVTAAQLSSLVAGGTSPKLFEPLDSGLWLAVQNGDTVTSFAQQYRP